MCKYCKDLLNVPSNKKAKVILKDYSKESYDANVQKMFMEVNHEESGEPYAFIKSDVVIESTGRAYGISFPIMYCPNCGKKLY